MTRTPLVHAPNPGQAGSIGATRAGIATLNFDEVDPIVGVSINKAREEVDDALKDMETFVNREPDEIMRLAAGHSARLSHIRVCIMRIEDARRQWKDVRVREIEPAIAELQWQWAHGSRLHSVREFDYKVETGER